jgi:hypothetical protein
MRHIHNLINITVLATVLVSPAAMAQQQLLTTQVAGLQQHVLTHNPETTSVASDKQMAKVQPSSDTATKKPLKPKVILSEPTIKCFDKNGNPIPCK